MQSLKIILTAILAACLYGIAHDQVTARVCVEYFTIGHPDIFHTTSPTLLAFGWGVVATWHVGLLLGVMVAYTARRGPAPKFRVAQLIKPLLVLLAILALASATAGFIGYHLAQVGRIQLHPSFANLIAPDRHPLFLADLYAHNAAYSIGFLAAVGLCLWIFVKRRRTRQKG